MIEPKIVKDLTALAILIPEAESFVKPIRDQFDPSSKLGMPAHITILYPFKHPDKIDKNTLSKLTDIFSAITTFEIVFHQTKKFPEVLYLEPTPMISLKALIQAVSQAFPDYLPYEGAHKNSIPHLTIAHHSNIQQLEQIESDFHRNHGYQLPFKSRVNAIHLWKRVNGRWYSMCSFNLLEP